MYEVACADDSSREIETHWKEGRRMTVAEIDKQLVFIDMVLGAIQNVEVPMLMYEGEKEVVKQALTNYRFKLEDKLIHRMKQYSQSEVVILLAFHFVSQPDQYKWSNALENNSQLIRNQSNIY